MAIYVKYTAAVEPMMEAIQAQTDAWKIALASVINAADTAFTPGITDLATSGGYTAGGNAATLISASASLGTYKLVLNNPAVWTASGGGFTFRYIILWDSTQSVPVGYWDYGSSVVMNGTNADTFTATLDGTNGVFQVS